MKNISNLRQISLIGSVRNGELIINDKIIPLNGFYAYCKRHNLTDYYDGLLFVTFTTRKETYLKLSKELVLSDMSINGIYRINEESYIDWYSFSFLNNAMSLIILFDPQAREKSEIYNFISEL